MKFLFLLALWTTSAFAEARLSIVENKEYRVGDTISLRIELPNAENIDQWEIVANTDKRWLASGPIIIDRSSLKAAENGLIFEAIVGDSGSLPVPKFTLRNKRSSEILEVAGEMAINASSVLSPEEKPRWLLGLADYGGYNQLVIALALLLLGLVAAWIIYFLWRRFSASRKKVLLNAKDEALREIKQLQSFARGKVTTLEDWKVFAYKLVNILKHYCERNFNFQTHDLTDRELLQQLQARLSRQSEAQALGNILSELDQVRYGTKDLDVTAAPRLLVDAKDFVERTFVDKEVRA